MSFNYHEFVAHGRAGQVPCWLEVVSLVVFIWTEVFPVIHLIYFRVFHYMMLTYGILIREYYRGYHWGVVVLFLQIQSRWNYCNNFFSFLLCHLSISYNKKIFKYVSPRRVLHVPPFWCHIMQVIPFIKKQ